MSYILEALRKADQEREFGAVPGLATPHETDRPGTRSRRWPWVIAVLLSVNVVLVALLLVKRDAEAPHPALAAPERQQTGADDPLVQALERTREDGTSPAPSSDRAAPTENRPTFSTGELAASPRPVDSLILEPLSQPENAAETQVETVAAASDTQQLQSWYELPQDFRMRISLPRLDLHVYSDNPQNRFILVKLKKYHEGETLESGLVLEEILPDGMVMHYRGERFFVEK
jgi:general secretion pathway protein B